MQHLSGGENLFRLGGHKLLLDSESHPNATAAATTPTSNHRLLLLLLQPKKRAPRRRSAAIVQKPEPRPVTSRRSRCNTRSRSSTDQGRHRKKKKKTTTTEIPSPSHKTRPQTPPPRQKTTLTKKQILYSNPSTKNSPEKFRLCDPVRNDTKKIKISPRSLHNNSSRKIISGQNARHKVALVSLSLARSLAPFGRSPSLEHKRIHTWPLDLILNCVWIHNKTRCDWSSHSLNIHFTFFYKFFFSISKRKLLFNPRFFPPPFFWD